MLLDPNTLQEVLDDLLGYELRFVDEFMVDFNPKAALKRARVPGAEKPKSLSRLVHKLLDKEPVKKLIAHKRSELGLDSGVTPKRVLRELAQIGFMNINELMTMVDGSPTFRDLDDMRNSAVIKEIKISSMSGDFKDGKILEIKLHDKMKALDLLGKHCALFTENVNLTTNGKDLPATVNTVNIAINHRAPGQKISRAKR